MTDLELRELLAEEHRKDESSIRGERCSFEAALSAMRRAVEMQTRWQPIESAPKDGNTILLFFAAQDCAPWVDACYWDDAWGKDKEGTWVIACECEHSCARPQAYYTHWLPLPSPPGRT